MASSSMFSRISAFFKEVSDSFQLTDYVNTSFGDVKGNIVDFPLENVHHYRGETDISPKYREDVDQAYIKHSQIRSFCANQSPFAERENELFVILRSSEDSFDSIISLIFLAARDRRAKDVNYLLNLTTYAGAPLSFHNTKIERLNDAVFGSGLNIIHHLVMDPNDNNEVLSVLLNYDIDGRLLEKKGGTGKYTPLLIAAFAGSNWAIRPLLDAGASPGEKDSSLNTVLHLASANIKSGISGEVMLKLFFESSETVLEAMVNLKNREGHTCVTLAAARGDSGALSVLLAHGASAISKGYSPLCYAALNGQCESIKLLIKHGASVNDTNRDGLAALTILAAEGNLECMKVLLEKQHSFEIVEGALEKSLSSKKLKCAYLILQRNLQAGYDFSGFLRSVILLDVSSYDDTHLNLYRDILRLLVRHGSLRNEGFELLKLSAQRQNNVAYEILLSSNEWSKDELNNLKKVLKSEVLLVDLQEKIRNETFSCVCCFEESNEMVKFSPCGHIQCCKDCFEDLQRAGDDARCPMCRKVLDIPNCEVLNS